ncbi:MAG: ParB N-terminal domain-containing protein [Gammaproteobacteria bacterium]
MKKATKKRTKQTPRRHGVQSRKRAASACKPIDWIAGEDYDARVEQPCVRPSDIKLRDRHRKDLGDLKALAADINTRGLLHPIVVDLRNTLIAGARRLAAWKLSNFRDQAIPVHTVPLADIVAGEWAENDPRLRKDFTPSEAVAIKRAISTWPSAASSRVRISCAASTSAVSPISLSARSLEGASSPDFQRRIRRSSAIWCARLK